MLLPPSVPIPDTLKGIDELIRIDFETFRATWFARLLAATFLVAVGLVMEGPELWHEIHSIIWHWNFRRRFHFSLPEEHTPEWVKLLAFVGWIFIVAGVGGEFVADSFVSKADGYVQKFDEILLSEAQRGTALAKERASAAYERASENENEAAKLRKDAEQLKSDNLKLETLIQPRDLSPEQRDAIQDALQAFSGKFVLVLASPDPEAIRFAELIGFAINSKRKIPVQFGPLQEGFTIPPRTGVEVTGTDEQFVSALKHALFSIGHVEPAPPLTQPRHSFGGLTVGAITPKTPDATVYVGLKPLKFLQPN
jgi:hypothetical protein